MIVTGAFFADAAGSSDGKLFAVGAVWDWYTLSELGQPVNITFVVLVQYEPDEPDDLILTLEVIDPNGISAARAEIGGPPPRGVRLGFRAESMEIAFAVPGLYTFLFQGTSGAPVAVPLHVRVRAD